jgi:3-oxoacyl-[acyl-carrier protein] reductase
MIILITGTSRGIGKYLAGRFLETGHTVIGFCRSECDIANKNFYHFAADVTDEKAIVRALGEVRKQFGYIDVLINNAGIAAMNHFCLTPIETAKRVMNVNFFGTFLMTRECSKLLRKSKNARIVNFSTVAVPLNLEGEASYAASKAAIESLTRTTAKELSKYGITVNAVGPVPVKTALIAGVPEDKIQNLLGHQAIKRFGEPEDIYNVIDFYIRPESNFITGQIMYLGGIN